jgi:hypothetical protein
VRAGFGIKVTLTLCRVSGIYPKMRQAVKILTSGPDKIPIPFFKSAGKIPCSPADLTEPKPLSDFVGNLRLLCLNPVLKWSDLILYNFLALPLNCSCTNVVGFWAKDKEKNCFKKKIISDNFLDPLEFKKLKMSKKKAQI